MRHGSMTGFTLLELMISVGLGSSLIIIAMMGLRAASISTSTINAIFFQTQVLRHGFMTACNEVDFWFQADMPGQPDLQASRTLNPDGSGRPFSPFQRSWPKGELGTSFGGGRAERLLGWNPSPMAWTPSDPRTWLRINLAERAHDDTNGAHCSALWFGDYSLFEGLDPERPPTPTYGSAIPANMRTRTIPWEPTRCRSWYANQLKGAIDAMGFYGLFEYLPSHTLWGYHGENPKGAPAIVSKGGMASSLTACGGWLSCNDSDYFARGRCRNTRAVSVPLPNPGTEACAALTAPGQGRSRSADPFRTYWLVGEGIDTYAGDRSDLLGRYMRNTRFDEMVMPVRPAEWPSLDVTIHRYIKNSRMMNVCILEIVNPVNGELTSLPFTCTGTTLRGARMQRVAGTANGGWSSYDNANPRSIVLGPTLDWENPRTIAW